MNRYFSLRYTPQLFGIAIVLALVPPASMAQSRMLEEVVVTATKRGTESAQDLAMSITALGEETLKAMGVTEFTDFSRSVPGLDVVDRGPGQKRYLIRGLNLPGESAVGLYYDNIPFAGNGDDAATFGGNQADIDMYDTNRVEVLRGPQGTLYGTNSVSGVVRVITNKPDASAFDGNLSLDGAAKKDGDPNWSGKGMVNIPLIQDTLAVRGSAYYSKQGGFLDNVILNKDPSCFGVQAPNPEITLLDGPGCNDGSSNLKDVNSSERVGGRLAMLWNLTEDTKILLQGFYQDTETDGRNFASPLDAFNPGPGFIAMVRGGSSVIMSEAAGERQTTIQSLENTDDELWITAFELEHNFDWATGHLSASYLDRDRLDRLDSSNPARLHRSFVAAMTPPPIAGAVVSPTDTVNLIQNQGTEMLNFEARLASSFEGPLNFLAGFFYQEIDRDIESQGLIADPATGRVLSNDAVLALLSPADLAKVNAFPWYASGEEDFNITHRVAANSFDTLAVFGEVYFDLFEQVELMAGFRYFDTELKQTSTIIVPFLNSIALQGAGPGTTVNAPVKEDDFLFKGQITYRPTEDHQVYFQIAEGFRAGGVNPQLVSTIPPDFKSDRTLNLEVGAKTSWLDGRLIANISAFTVDWDNIQFEADFTQQFSGLINCTEAEDAVQAEGIELDLQALVTDNLDIGFNYTVLNAEWQVDANDCVTPALLATTNDKTLFQMKGDKLVGVPDFSGSAFVQYNFNSVPLLSGLGAQTAFIRSDIQFQGQVDRNEDVLNQNLPNPSYVLANINAGVDFGKYSVSLYVRNLSDEEAHLSLFQGFQQPNRVTAAQPRTIGINVSYNFAN